MSEPETQLAVARPFDPHEVDELHEHCLRHAMVFVSIELSAFIDSRLEQIKAQPGYSDEARAACVEAYETMASRLA